MSALNPNQTLLQGKNQSTTDLTPAPLSPNNSLVSFAFKGVQPPSLLYVDVDDQLVLQAATSTTGEVVTVNVRLLKPDGRLEDNQFQIRPVNTRASLTQKFSLAQGYILSASAVCTQAITRGQTFLRIATQRSASGAGSPAQMLFADYVTTLATSAYPNGRVLAPTEGPGWLNVVTVGNPVAGADWTITVPLNARWRPMSVNATFTTSATVANRNPSLEVFSSAGVEWQGGILASIPASQIASINGGALTPWVSTFPNLFTIGIPPALVIAQNALQAMGLRSLTNGIAAADQWSAITILLEEWLDNV